MKRIVCLLICILILVSITSCIKDCPCSDNRPVSFDCIECQSDTKLSISNDSIIITDKNKIKKVEHKEMNCFILENQKEPIFVSVQKKELKK